MGGRNQPATGGIFRTTAKNRLKYVNKLTFKIKGLLSGFQVTQLLKIETILILKVQEKNAN